ncbi:MAG: GlsB/YeaQ/YmgE family stress response membrane protein [Acidiferrobacterales bacterium]
MSVTITVGQIIVWVIVGALAGSLAGMIVKRRREGFGRFNNLIVGLVGAVIGGFIFKLFGIDLGLGQIAISFEDLIAAFVGSLIFLGIVWFVQKRGKTL